jgi:hypothetical protein
MGSRPAKSCLKKERKRKGKKREELPCVQTELEVMLTSELNLAPVRIVAFGSSLFSQ